MFNFMPIIIATNEFTSTNRVSCMSQVLMRFTGLRPVFLDKNLKKSCNDQIEIKMKIILGAYVVSHKSAHGHIDIILLLALIQI